MTYRDRHRGHVLIVPLWQWRLKSVARNFSRVNLVLVSVKCALKAMAAVWSVLTCSLSPYLGTSLCWLQRQHTFTAKFITLTIFISSVLSRPTWLSKYRTTCLHSFCQSEIRTSNFDSLLINLPSWLRWADDLLLGSHSRSWCDSAMEP